MVRITSGTLDVKVQPISIEKRTCINLIFLAKGFAAIHPRPVTQTSEPSGSAKLW